MAFSRPPGISCHRNFLGNFLFNNALAGTFIATLGWLCPFLYLSSTLSSILHGLGHPGITFELNLVSCTIRILFVLLAVPVWGIRSYLWGILVVSGHGTVVHLYTFKENRRIHIRQE